MGLCLLKILFAFQILRVGGVQGLTGHPPAVVQSSMIYIAKTSCTIHISFVVTSAWLYLRVPFTPLITGMKALGSILRIRSIPFTLYVHFYIVCGVRIVYNIAVPHADRGTRHHCKEHDGEDADNIAMIVIFVEFE